MLDQEAVEGLKLSSFIKSNFKSHRQSIGLRKIPPGSIHIQAGTGAEPLTFCKSDE